MLKFSGRRDKARITEHKGVSLSLAFEASCLSTVSAKSLDDREKKIKIVKEEAKETL